MQINIEDSTDLQRLNQLCLPCWDSSIKTLALRPERPEYAIFTEHPQDTKWVQVLKYLERDICYRLQRFTTLYQKPSVGLYLDTLGYLHTLTPNLGFSLQAIAAILYDQEMQWLCKRSRDAENRESIKKRTDYFIQAILP